MSNSQTVSVNLGHSRTYEITIGAGLLAHTGELLKPKLRSPRVLLITDRSVAKLHLQILQNSLSAAGLKVAEPIVVEPGEQTKSLSAFEGLIEAMLERAMERSVTVIALGGGVVGDLAGFAAATVLRGVDFVQIPTTLLAQVDSSVGGKTGLNTRHGKNLLGAFHQPKAVLIDPTVLQTLPRRELLAGYAEIIKYGLIDDTHFFDWCEANGSTLISGDVAAQTTAINKSCANKARIVALDEHESGPRMLLNLGHTFAHALEAECGYNGSLLHGEAVAVGLVLAAELSARLNLCAADIAPRLAGHLHAVGLPAAISETPCKGIAPEKLLAHMLHDKKVQDGKLTFILLKGIGQAFIARGIAPNSVLPVLAP
jgi:3-dehydroquinate synthase